MTMLSTQVFFFSSEDSYELCVFLSTYFTLSKDYNSFTLITFMITFLLHGLYKDSTVPRIIQPLGLCIRFDISGGTGTPTRNQQKNGCSLFFDIFDDFFEVPQRAAPSVCSTLKNHQIWQKFGRQ